MLIPLDYYRILGLPIQTSAEQLQQAYRDRTLQLPRREYSQAAIEARKQLLEAAYTVLFDPEQRQRYNASYFAHAYGSEADSVTESTSTQSEISTAVDPHTPSIEIDDKLFVGALLILQELGEYELVLNLGLPFLNTSNAKLDRLGGSNLVRSDSVLTIALACLELGREQWQQGQYESAAASLASGQNLLLSEGLFPNVENEIRADLYKLRPYRILELLSTFEDNVTARKQGLQLLQEMLQQRNGIDGNGEDGSGLGVEEFLRFIQQLRSYLTAAEQQRLFEAESKRPSAVATYLAVYALIARGFAHRQPVLIRQAKLMLTHLSKRQDLYLEQAICSMLLGQTTQASRALELSQDYEPLAFIQEHSQSSPDLLPGLCLYSESWLQTEVFPHFRDLSQQQASLKDYFADEQVQAYLEALPTQLDTTSEWIETHPQVATEPQTTRTTTTREQVQTSPPTTTFPGETWQKVQEGGKSRQQAEFSSKTKSANQPSDFSVTSSIAVLPAAKEGTTIINQNQNISTSEQASPHRLRRRKRNAFARSWGIFDHQQRQSSQHSSFGFAIGNVLEAKKTRFVLLLVGSTLVVVLWFLVSQVYGLLKQTFFPVPSVSEEELMVQLNQPPLPIPTPQNQQQAATKLLNQETAGTVIQGWLSAKSAAFSSSYAVDRLGQILVEPVLSQWQQRVKNDKASNRYRQYKHSVKVNSVETKKLVSDRASVEATVNEVAQVYENGKLNQKSSYSEDVRVRYDLVRKNGQWHIQKMTVLR